MASGGYASAWEVMHETEFYASLLDHLDDLVWVTSLDGQHLLYINAAASLLYGRPVSELASDDQAWFEGIHADDRPAVRGVLKRLAEGNESRIVRRFRLVQPKGESRWLQGTFCVIRGGGGEPLRLGCLAQDISARIQAEQQFEEAKAIYHSLVESLPINVFRKDREGRIVFGNSRYCRSLGQTLDQLQGKTDDDLFSPNLARKYRSDDLWVLQTGLPFHDIEEHPGPEGGVTYVEVLKAPVTDARAPHRDPGDVLGCF